MRNNFIKYYCILTYLILFPFMLPGQNAASPNLPEGVLTPSQVNKDMIGKVVTVQGLVVKYEPTWNEHYPNSMYIRDTTGNTLHVVYWKQIGEAMGPERTPKPGQLLRVKGQVNEFRGEINLKITTPEDIVDVGSDVQEKIPAMPLNSITKDNLNQAVKIQGQVVNIRLSWKPTAPDIITISDGGDATVSVVYWADVKDRLQPQDLPEVGKIILVEGWVDVYRDLIQVKVDNPYKLKCVGGTASPPPADGSAGSAPASSMPQTAQIASVNTAPTSNPAPASPQPAFGYSNPFAPPQNTPSPEKQASGASNVNPNVGQSGIASQLLPDQPGSPASDSTVNKPPLTQSAPPQTPKGPGFYTIDRAPRVIQGPPQRPHVLFFTSQDYDPYSNDPLFLELSSKVVFVWIDINESAHIAKQVDVKTDPTWIFYDAGGLEKTRNTGALTTAQLAQTTTLISK
jgi:DNA/RNA endonuclease YhcR with UshA esterase domain